MKDLLLLLAHYPYDESTRERIAELLGAVKDWDSFVKLVNANGIIALAAYNLKEARLGYLVPAKAMAILENGLMQSMLRNTWLTEKWKEVNKILNEAGIKHILLKGMALEHTLYGSRGLRQMTDTDILIRKDEAVKAWQILQNNGFSLAEMKSPLHKKIMLNFGQHLPALFKGEYAVEIHTSLDDTKNFNAAEYYEPFERAVEIKINETIAWILPKEIHLKYLIRHHTRHALAGECQLRTYNDIKLIDPENNLEFPDEFVFEPSQSYKRFYRRAHYRATVFSVPKGSRVRFVIGDIFPSLRWMRKRYSCDTLSSFLRYPQRMGKLVWLV